MKLYEMTQEYNQLLEMMNDPDASPEAIQEVLSSLEGQIEQKAENIAKVIKSMEADIEAISNEEKRLQAKRKALENHKEGLKQYLQQSLEQVGLNKVKTALFNIGIQNNPASVEIVDEEAIPEVFVTWEKKILKSDILKQLKEGHEIPGVQMKQTRSLRIR